MSEIHLHNYEAYLLDSMEGRLTAEQQRALDSFMALHPELAVDLDELMGITFDPEQTLFLHKDVLKKTEADLVSGEQFIGYIERQLSPEESLRVEEHCAAVPALAKELDLYKKTIAVADTNIVFEDKERLKRRTKVILFNFRAASFAAAASVIVLFLLYVLWPAKTADVVSNSYAMRNIRKASGKGNNAAHTTASPSSVKDHLSLPEHRPETTFPKQVPVSEKLIAHNQPQEHAPATPTASVTNPDTIRNLVSAPEKVKEQALNPKEPVLIVSASRKTKVEVITENDGEENTESQKKTGFWAMAGKTLKGLNKAGVKTVNGEEKNNKDNASYALTLGGMSITHKAH